MLEYAEVLPMPVAKVGMVWAFLAGFVSFLSPCVLPLIPGYLSFVSGVSIEDLRDGGTAHQRLVLVSSGLFVLGFTVVFVALGASASIIGSLLLSYKATLSRVAGLLIVVFGLSVIGWLRLPFFYRRGWRPAATARSKPATVALGMAFAFAWTPCVGPILTSILLFAGAAATVGTGMRLLFVYALGLGVPFIVTGLLLHRLLGGFDWIKRHYRLLNIVSGLLLIGMGVLLATNQIVYVNSFLRHIQARLGLNWITL